MKSQMTALLICTLLLVVCTCDQSLEEYAPREERQFALAYLDSIRDGNLEAAKRYLHPTVDTVHIDRNIMGIAGSFPPGELVEVKTVGFEIDKRAPGGVTQSGLAFQYHFEDGWLLARVSLEKSAGEIFVKALNVTPLSKPLESARAFTLRGKSDKHYVFLGLAIAIPAFIIVTFIICLRTPMKRLKWLWAMFVLIGIGVVGFNWTAGQVTEYTLTARLLGMRISSESPFSPWMVKVAFPLGAIIFLAKRKALARKAGE